MNIDIIVTQFEPGGAQKASIALANGLAKNNYKVRLIFFYNKSHFNIYISNKVKVIFLQNEATFIKRFLYTPYLLIKLWFYKKPDCVISFTHYANIYSSIIAKIYSIPILISHRNPLHSHPVLAKFGIFLITFFNLIDGIIYVSKSTRDTFYKFNQYVKCKEFIIYNCVKYNSLYENKNLMMEFKNNFNTPDNFILNVGRMTPQKNQQILIYALSKSSFTGKLLLVGQGPLRNDLKILADSLSISDKVIFKDTISNDEVLKLLSSCLALAMPSKYEGMSNVLLEAIVHGTHTIISNVPSLIESVSLNDDYYGDIVNDIDGWVSSFNKLNNRITINHKLHNDLRKRYQEKKFIRAFEKSILSVTS